MEEATDIETTCFQIISFVGAAKSTYIEAMHQAKAGNYEKAEALIAEGDEAFAEGHKVHLELLQSEAQSIVEHADGSADAGESAKTGVGARMGADTGVDTGVGTGIGSGTPLLLVHAEDQLASAETIKVMALEIISLYKKLSLKD